MLSNTAQRIFASGMWIAVVIASVLLLAACGGGGGGAGIAPHTPQQPVAKAYNFGVAAQGAVGATRLTAVQGADGKYIVQPITVTVWMPYISVVHEVVVTIEERITVSDRQITLEGGRVITPGDEPTPPPVADNPNPPATPPPTPPAPPSPPPAEDPPLTPVNNDPPPPQESETPANDTPGEGGISPLPSRALHFFPGFSSEILKEGINGPTTTITSGGGGVMDLPGALSLLLDEAATIEVVSVNIGGDYVNSVFVRKSYGVLLSQSVTVDENGMSITTTTPYPEVRSYINTVQLTTGINFLAFDVVPGGSPSIVVNRESYIPDINAVDFFCQKGILTVLIYLSKNTSLLCGSSGGRAEHRPNKSDIAGGALQDIGARGFGFADTPARFYARWGNKEKRKQAGFSYNFDTFALRTDYNKLPAAQDAKVMLDTYRVGIMPDIGKRHRLFAGVDNYRNGILAIQYTDAADTNTHTNIYKLGSVAGKGGYAVKFEWRVVWD